MKDSYGRDIDYMRISLTDRCNLRCRYCMPDGIQCVPMADILTFEEICVITEAAAQLGIRHLKITGGEPLVRKGCCSLIRTLKKIPGIEKVTITTNGMLLGQYLDELMSAGIDGINISLDTRNRRLFEKITGTDGLDTVMESIRKCSGLPIPVKVNAVSLQLESLLGQEHMERENWQDMVELAREYPVDVRFIEMMPIGCGRNFPAISHETLLSRMKAQYAGMEADPRSHGFGPAVYYTIPGFQGSIGFISAIHGKFCGSCNRIRLTSQGFLKACLCYENGVDLRKIVRTPCSVEEKLEQLKAAISRGILEKPGAHCFENLAGITETGGMSSIGG